MKKTTSLIVTLIVVAITSTSFKNEFSSQRLYPELNSFFKSINVKQFDDTHFNALENMKYRISLSNLDLNDLNLIFYCIENTFRSQASQIFAQTLCYARKHKKVKSFSAGLSPGEINPKLIAFLIKVGYRISKSVIKGKTIYQVKFSDQAPAITLFSKVGLDNSLPSEEITSVVVCDVVKEAECADLLFESAPLNLPFEKVNEEDSDEKIEATIKSIAAVMLYVTSK